MARYTQTCTETKSGDLYIAVILSILFSYCVTCLTLDWTCFICFHTEGDQQSEGSLQRLVGALRLEPVDSLEKCNLLMLFVSNTVCSCSFFVLTVYNVLSCPLFFTVCFWLFPLWDNHTLIANR